MTFLLTYIAFISILYTFIGWDKIMHRILMYKDKNYWTDYNVIEFSAWMAKAIIIVNSPF